jgi:hypothetical protein
MSTPPLSQQDFLDLLDFSSEFGTNIDFGADFGFGADFAAFDSTFIDSGSYEYGGVSCEFSVKGFVQRQRPRRCRK